MLAVADALTKMDMEIKAIFIGAAFPPKFLGILNLANNRQIQYNEKYVVSYMRQAGVSEDILNNMDYIRYMRSVLRHDKISFYAFFDRGMKPTKCKIPMYAVIGDQDPSTKHFQRRYLGWYKYFEEVHLFVLKNAGHFFINSHHNEIVDLFQSILF
jgi:surfactin synthase thioesterase subunit